MNFSSMDYFVMVARERSFTRAAQRLHITQQTLSAHIAGLEQELGSQLLIRHVPLELTYAGEVFLRYASEFQKKREAMEREFSDISDDQKGLLRIGIASTRGHAVMPTLIGGFQHLHPRIEIRLVEAANDRLCRDLEDGEIDLAIANFPESVPGIALEDFYQEEIVLLMSDVLLQRVYGAEQKQAQERLRSGDLTVLRDCPLLLSRSEDIAGRIGRALLLQAGIAPEAKVESSNIETLLELCARGVGACFCPGNLMKATLAQARLACLNVFHFSEGTRYPIRFGYRKQTYRWSVISDFIAFSRQTIPACL